jgi:hypothetical protein
MPPNVTATAMLTCSFGIAPSTLNVLPVSRVMIEGKPAATIKDMVPMMNLPPFGMCTSLTNPMVATATAAALGVLTPMPCIPVPVGPWKPGAAKTLIGNMPALTSPSICNCSWSGVITIGFPGSTRTMSG